MALGRTPNNRGGRSERYYDRSFASLIAVTGLVLVHLFCGKLNLLRHTPRSVWLSMAGGVPVAYVFVHLLPEHAEAQEVLDEATGEALVFLESHAYLVALLGLTVFYGLERAAKVSRQRERESGKEDPTSSGVFWIHTSSFAVYNAIIG